MKPEQAGILAAFAATIVLMAAHDGWVEKFIGWVGKPPAGNATQAAQLANAQQYSPLVTTPNQNVIPNTGAATPNTVLPFTP